MSNAARAPVIEAPDRQREPAEHPGKGSPPGAPLKTKRRWGGRLLGLGVLVLLGAALAYGTSRYYQQQKEVQATAEQRRDFVPHLRVGTVAASPPTIAVNLPATTLAFTAANIFARVSGYIQKRHVDIGDRVKKDQLLLEIYAPEIEHQISQAQAQLILSKQTLRQNEANRDLAQITWDRDRPLVRQGWVTQQQGSVDEQNLKAQEAAVAVSKATIDAQEAQIRILVTQKNYQSVNAPFDGIVTQRNVDVGDLVQGDTASTSTLLFTVMASSVIRTQVYVPQDQAMGLTPGVPAVVRVPEIPNRTFPGKVTRVADALQPGSRTLLAEIDIPNPDRVLSPGMYTSIELQVPRKTPSLLVPGQSVIFNSNGLQVGVVENGVVHFRKLTVLRDLGTELEVSDGVHPGDKVVLNPPVNLLDGSRVKARPQTPAQARE